MYMEPSFISYFLNQQSILCEMFWFRCVMFCPDTRRTNLRNASQYKHVIQCKLTLTMSSKIIDLFLFHQFHQNTPLITQRSVSIIPLSIFALMSPKTMIPICHCQPWIQAKCDGLICHSFYSEALWVWLYNIHECTTRHR